MYIDYEVFDASKKEPTIGFNIEPNELQYARNYKSFLGYERSAEPFNIFGKYKLLGKQNSTLIRKFLPLKISKHS